jgi:hypothetical protein
MDFVQFRPDFMLWLSSIPLAASAAKITAQDLRLEKSRTVSRHLGKSATGGRSQLVLHMNVLDLVQQPEHPAKPSSNLSGKLNTGRSLQQGSSSAHSSPSSGALPSVLVESSSGITTSPIDATPKQAALSEAAGDAAGEKEEEQAEEEQAEEEQAGEEHAEEEQGDEGRSEEGISDERQGEEEQADEGQG